MSKAAGQDTFLTRTVGRSVAAFRDGVARRVGRAVHPNTLTILGFLLTVLAAPFLALGGGDALGPAVRAGQSYHRLVAFVFLLLAAAMDMLDGTVARLTGRVSRFGAFLDSNLDRYSDVAVFAGMALWFAREPNLTFLLLSILGMGNALMVSYAKARGENLIPSLSIGYWQRPERWVGILCAVLSGHLRIFVALMAGSCLLTVGRRVHRVWEVLSAESAGREPPPSDPREQGGWHRLCLWSYPRNTLGYDVVSVAAIALMLFCDLPAVDPLAGALSAVGHP